MKFDWTRYKKLTQWVLAFLCLAYIISFFIKNSEKLKIVSNIDPVIILEMVCFFVLGHIIFTWQFKIILTKCSGKKIPFFTLFRMIILSRFLSMLAPQAGKVYQSITLKKKYHISYTKFLSSFFSITWLDTCLNLIFAIVIILAIKPNLLIAEFKASYLLFILICIIGIVPVIVEFVLNRIEFRNKYLAWVHGRLSEMLGLSVKSLSDGPFILKIILTGGLTFINAVIIFYLCFRSLGVDVNVPALCLFCVIMKLCNRIMITPGNLGIREIAYGVLSEQMQIGMEQGLIISIVMRLIGTGVIFAFGILFGGLSLIKEQRKDLAAPEYNDIEV